MKERYIQEQHAGHIGPGGAHAGHGGRGSDWIKSLPKDTAGKMKQFRLLNEALKGGQMKFKRGERKLMARRIETLAKDILGAP